MLTRQVTRIFLINIYYSIILYKTVLNSWSVDSVEPLLYIYNYSLIIFKTWLTENVNTIAPSSVIVSVRMSAHYYGMLFKVRFQLTPVPSNIALKV